MRSALLFSFLCGNFRDAIAKVHYGFQSGAILNSKATDVNDANPTNDDSFASGLHYDSRNSLVYVTGGTYSRYWDSIGSSGGGSNVRERINVVNSDCFLAVLKVPSNEQNEGDGGVDKEMKVVYARRFGTESTPEACSAVMYTPSVSDTARAITLGHTEEGGLLTSLRSKGSRKASTYGFMMDFDIGLTKKNGKVVDVSGKIDGGRLMYDFPVQYPIAVATDPRSTSGKDMFVALLSSPIHSRDDAKQVPGVHPDPTQNEDITGYGKDFRVVIEMSEPKSQATLDYEKEIGEFDEGGVRETIVGGWKRAFSPNGSSETSGSDTRPSLQVSDLIYIPRMTNSARNDVLVLVGTTNGHGPEFGGPETKGNSENYGFITKINPTDGDTDASIGGSVATTRVGAAKSENSIKGICFQRGLDNVEYIYVVGFTNGLLDNTYMQRNQLSIAKDNKVSKHAFVTKLELRTLRQVWSRQIGSQNGEDVIGHGCDISPDGSTVYLAGTVKNGGSIRYIEVDELDENSQSSGGDDIFVASYSTAGPANFIRQFGTAEDDTFARGKSIVCDKTGNAIVLGNTRGSMMRLRGDHDKDIHKNRPNDIFVMSIGKTKGKIPSIAEKFPERFKDNVSINAYSDSDEDTERLFTVEKVAIIISSVIMFFTILYALCNVKWVAGDGAKWNSNDRVMDYLDEFNDNDIELHVRHSATGGVHGIYDFEAKTSSKPPTEVTVGFDENAPRPSSRMSKEDSLKVMQDALDIVDSNKTKLAPGRNSNDDMSESLSSNISWKDREQYRLDGAASISNSTVQASNIKEHESQNGSNAFSDGDNVLLPDVNENHDEDEDWEKEII